MLDTVTIFNNNYKNNNNNNNNNDNKNHFIKVSNLLAEHRHSTQIKSNVSFGGEGKT